MAKQKARTAALPWLGLALSAGFAQGACAQSAMEDQQWSGKALMVEAKAENGKWQPFKTVGLSRAGFSAEDSEPKIEVWRESYARRVVIFCAGQEFAWEQLSPAASAQLEFGCSGRRFRAQVGRIPAGWAQDLEKEQKDKSAKEMQGQYPALKDREVQEKQ